MAINNSYSLIGYASESGATTSGTKDGPDHLRKSGLLQALQDLGLSVTDEGNATEHEIQVTSQELQNKISKAEHSVLRIEGVYRACLALSRLVSGALDRGNIPLLLGGDHSLSIGSISAISNFYRKKGEQIGLLWLDAHPDLNTPDTSPSHCVFGMSAAVLLGYVPGLLSSLQNPFPAISEDKLVYVGLRDVDPGERVALRNSKVRAFTMKDIDSRGLASVMDEAISIVTQGSAGFVTSFDLDVCDPAIVPGTGTPYRGGLTFREAHLALELVFDSNQLLGFELVELNPKFDKEFHTTENAISFIEAALGKAIL